MNSNLVITNNVKTKLIFYPKNDQESCKAISNCYGATVDATTGTCYYYRSGNAGVTPRSNWHSVSRYCEGEFTQFYKS